MQSLFLVSFCFLFTACATPTTGLPAFKNTAEAEVYLRDHKACPGCDLRRAELGYSDLRGADLRAANLKGADFTRADLREANLEGAILVRADLSTLTQLEGANLKNTDLTEANISPSELRRAKTCGAILPNGQRAEPCLDKN
jgi:uncharacterized protein YjbI with pentapeptide repeats